MIRAVAQLYRYRWLIVELVMRNLRLRYRGSILGFAWTLFNPIIFMGIYTLVFAIYLKNGIHNFPLFILAGIIPFNWLASAISQGTTAVLDGRSYIGKTLFPAEVLVVVPTLTNGVNFVLSLPFLIIYALFAHVHLGWNLLVLPLAILIELVLIQGAVTLLAALNVFYRDLQELVGYVVTALLFLTPIFYKASFVPPQFISLVRLNPLAGITEAFQSVLFSGTGPDWNALLGSAIFGFVLLAVGQWVFDRYRESFVEYL